MLRVRRVEVRGIVWSAIEIAHFVTSLALGPDARQLFVASWGGGIVVATSPDTDMAVTELEARSSPMASGDDLLAYSVPVSIP